MKSLFVLFTLLVLTALPARAGDFIIGAGVARETITDPVDVDIDLYKVKGFYRFDNDFTIGGVLQKGNPSIGFEENRYETTVGYNPLIGKTRVDVTLGYGVRDRVRATNVNYYYIELGAIRPIWRNIIGDVQYRYRDSQQLDNWNTHMYTVGLGYMLPSMTLIRPFYSVQKGDFSSNIVGLTVIKQF